MTEAAAVPVVIVGSGLAGYTAAREFRKLDRQTPLVVVSRDAAGFYSKPMLSNALAGRKTAATLVMKPAAKMAEELGATVRAHTEVRQIDTSAQAVLLADGESIAYRDLVLALGADPIRLPLEGDGVDDVLIGQRPGRLCALRRAAGRRVPGNDPGRRPDRLRVRERPAHARHRADGDRSCRVAAVAPVAGGRGRMAARTTGGGGGAISASLRLPPASTAAQEATRSA